MKAKPGVHTSHTINTKNESPLLYTVGWPLLPLDITASILNQLIQYKILEGENFSEFGELQEIHQTLLVQNFPS